MHPAPVRRGPPLIAYAKVYLLGGQLSQNELEKIRKYLINPVESREASVDKPATLVREHAAPDRVAVVEGFTALDEKGLAIFCLSWAWRWIWMT